ncbi:NAD(P)/FAD-dependent oxidoreductase [Streptomyces monticola]|uniref:NAD(P)/FAD-dependent oxidoreductase n=1 Tax=Streptomyces monticola TaxID=2666263 RepID=A0ABW2JF05_9ACTN
MKVVVVGAGYAGTYAANRVSKKVKGAEVTVVNPRPEFVERVRLHQQIAGTHSAATPLGSMLRAGITSYIGSVTKVGDGIVGLEDGTSLDFDYVFLAVGSTVRPMEGTVPVGTWEGAQRARGVLAALAPGSTVTVIGGGATGVETASEIAEARPDVRVRIVGTSVGEGLTHGARQRTRTGLERLGVDIVDDGVTEVAAGTGEFDGEVQLRSAASFASDLTLWAILSGVPELAARSGLEVDAEGRTVVDAGLRSVTDRRVFAVGDCAGVPGSRFACQTAGQSADHAVDSLIRVLDGHAPEPYSPRYVGRCVSLGRKDAVAQSTRRDDTLRQAYVTGRAGAALKQLAFSGSKFGSRWAVGG